MIKGIKLIFAHTVDIDASSVVSAPAASQHVKLIVPTASKHKNNIAYIGPIETKWILQTTKWNWT